MKRLSSAAQLQKKKKQVYNHKFNSKYIHSTTLVKENGQITHNKMRYFKNAQRW